MPNGLHTALLFGCSFLAISASLVSAEQPKIESPRPSEPEYSDFFRARAVQLVNEEKWEDAGEFLGMSHSNMLLVVEQAWDSHADWGAARRDRFRLKLAAFFFRHCDLMSLGWSSVYKENVRRLAREYEQLRKRVDLIDAEDDIDLTHAELFDFEFEHELPLEESREDRIKFEKQLRANPRSIPVIAFYCKLRKLEAELPDNNGSYKRPSSPPEDIVSGELRCAMAREVARSSWHGGSEGIPALEIGWQFAPSREEKAYLLEQLARLKFTSRPGREAFEIAQRVFEEFPQTRAAEEARALAVQNVIDASGADKALRFVKSMQARGEPQTKGLEVAWFNVAIAYNTQGRPQDAIRCLHEVLRRYPDTSQASHAMLVLSEIHQELGDHDTELAWLERCATSIELSRPARIMDTDNTRSVAIQRLAKRYEERNRWLNALQAWQKWRPSSWCGNCGESMDIQKCRALVRCQIHLGQFSQAVATCCDFLTEYAFLTVHGDPEVSAMLFVMYAHAEQIDDLRNIVEQLKTKNLDQRKLRRRPNDPQVFPLPEKASPTRDLSTLLHMHDLAENREYAALIEVAARANIADDSEMPTLFETTVARLIVRSVDGNPQPIADAMVGRQQGYRPLIFAISYCQSPRADDLLREYFINGVPMNSNTRFYNAVPLAILFRSRHGSVFVERVQHSDIPHASTTAFVALREFDRQRRSVYSCNLQRLSTRSLPHNAP